MRLDASPSFFSANHFPLAWGPDFLLGAWGCSLLGDGIRDVIPAWLKASDLPWMCRLRVCSPHLPTQASDPMGAAVETMDSRAIFRMDVGFYTGTIPASSEVLIQDLCPFGLPEMLTVAHAVPWLWLLFCSAA